MLAAWQVVREIYPGWSADSEIWAREAGDDVELVVCDRAREGFGEEWMRFLVRGPNVAEDYPVDAADWAADGFERLTPVVTPLDRFTTLGIYIQVAREAQATAARAVAASRARALVPALHADLATGALDFGFPDHAAAVADLAAAEAELATAEASLRK